MPTRRRRIPSYREHRSTGRAVVTLGGRDRYLGAYGTLDSLVGYVDAVEVWVRESRFPLPDGELVCDRVRWYWCQLLLKSEMRRGGVREQTGLHVSQLTDEHPKWMRTAALWFQGGWIRAERKALPAIPKSRGTEEYHRRVELYLLALQAVHGWKSVLDIGEKEKKQVLAALKAWGHCRWRGGLATKRGHRYSWTRPGLQTEPAKILDAVFSRRWDYQRGSAGGSGDSAGGDEP